MNSDNHYLGKWKITDMEVWDRDYIDLVVPGYIEFEPGDSGSFQFGTVRGWIDSRIEEFNNVEMIAFSWEGFNDTDPGCGRGWAMTVADGDGLHGRIYIHGSDDSEFRAERVED